MTLVVAILLIMFAFVVPNLVAVTRGRDVRKLQGQIIRLPIEARNTAVKTGMPATITVSGDTLVLQQTQTDGSTSQVEQVALDDTFSVDAAQLGGKSVDAGTWQWTAYPDGTSDSGGLQFSQGSVERSLVMPANGNPRWMTGALPDASQDKWQAGALQQRG